MKEVIKKLLTIKSLVTLMLTVAFVIMSVHGFKNSLDVPQYFQTIYSVVIAFYFGTQFEKKNDTESGDKSNSDKDMILKI